MYIALTIYIIHFSPLHNCVRDVFLYVSVCVFNAKIFFFDFPIY